MQVFKWSRCSRESVDIVAARKAEKRESQRDKEAREVLQKRHTDAAQEYKALINR